MASRILLLSPNRFSLPDPVFPLGLAHLNAALRRAGHEVEWLDFQVDDPRLETVMARYQPNLIGISLRNIDDVNICKQEVFFENLAGLCRTLRQLTRSPVVLGGSGFSIFPKRLLEISGADFGIQGEGEAPLVALVRALENSAPHELIPGLAFRKGDQVHLNLPQVTPFQEPLDEADFPQRLVDYYLKHGGMLNLQTQRGCAWQCCYCTYPLIEGNNNRRRPPDWIAEELAHFEKRGARYICMVDSVFNSTAEHVGQTCEAILKRSLQVKWGCFLRPQGLSPELMKLMARAGLSHIEFGSDSFCDTVLEAYGKNFTFHDILHSSRLASQENIDYCHYLICGGPGETYQTLQAGFDNGRKLTEGVVLAVMGMRIYPGTRLWLRAVQEQRISAEADLLAPVYYLAPGMTQAEISRRLQEFVGQCPRWIVGDPTPGYARAVERLRKRGVVGPLWSYFAMMQRLLPRTPLGSPA